MTRFTQLTCPGMLIRLVVLGLIAIAVNYVLAFATGPRWFSVFGDAMTVLVVLPVLGIILRNRLVAVGHSGHWAWLLIIPLLSWSLGTVAYWQVYFSSQGAAQMLGMVDSSIPQAQQMIEYGLWGSAVLGGAILSVKLAFRKSDPPRA